MTLRRYFSEHVRCWVGKQQGGSLLVNNSFEVTARKRLRVILQKVSRDEVAALGKECNNAAVTTSSSDEFESDDTTDDNSDDTDDDSSSSTSFSNQAKNIHMQEHLKNAPVSATAINMCRYRCKVCHLEFLNWARLRSHLRERISCWKLAKKYNWSDFVFKKVAHTCKLCGYLLPSDRSFIRSHVFTHHRIVVGTYIKLLTTKKTLSPQDIVDNDRTTEKKRQSHLRELEKYLKGKDQSKEVGNKCTFRCPNCQDEFPSSVTLKRHHKRVRNDCTGPGALRRIILNVIVKAVSYKCKICLCLLLCDRGSISSHTKANHGLSLPDYLEFAKQTKVDVQAIREQHQSKHQERENELQVVLDRVPMVPPELFVFPTMPPQSIPCEQTTHSVREICKFRCPKCSFEKRSFLAFRKHLLQCTGSGKYSPANALEARTHICHLCSKRILCDTYLIKSHVIYGHKVDYAKYEEEAKVLEKVEAKGGVIPLFGQEERDQRKALVPVVTTTTFEQADLVPPSQLSVKKATPKIEDFCRFRCSVCLSFESDKLYPMLKHKQKCTGVTTYRFNVDDLLEAR